MEKVCVLCNRLFKVSMCCPECGNELEDKGLIQDFYDPYSAYEEQAIYEDGYQGYTSECCVHLLYCSACEFGEFRPMKRLLEVFTNISLINNSSTGHNKNGGEYDAAKHEFY